MQQQFTLGMSPCPNDTFIFYALLKGKIKNGNSKQEIDFKPVIEDVEQLNQRAVLGELDITKLSFHAFGKLTQNYKLLNAGSALGYACGPMLISKNEITNLESKIQDLRIGIPGELTTANFLLSMAFPNAKNKIPMLFSEIEEKVLSGEIDAGLIIHENRFTYQEKGLVKLIDLGEWWEKESGKAIPLGGIVVNNRIPVSTQKKIDNLIRLSIEYAWENPDEALDFASRYAQEMDIEIMKRHINLYVNEFTADLGVKGRAAVDYMFEKAKSEGVLTNLVDDYIVPQNRKGYTLPPED